MDGGKPPAEDPPLPEPPLEPAPPLNPLEVTEPDEEHDEENPVDDSGHPSEEEDVVPSRPPMPVRRTRRLSTYESTDGGLDLESGGSARPKSYMSASFRSR